MHTCSYRPGCARVMCVELQQIPKQTINIIYLSICADFSCDMYISVLMHVMSTGMMADQVSTEKTWNRITNHALCVFSIQQIKLTQCTVLLLILDKTHNILLWARSSVARWPDFQMAAPINILAFSRQYHRRGANASVTEQLKGLAPVYSSNGNVQ